jgi:diacylglycerol kinase family enzyme
MRALLVVNPNATATTPGMRDVIAGALGSELKLDVVETDNRGHASELAAQARRDGVDLVVALGGDGTVNEVLDGLLADGPSPQVPRLAVVPGGSANVFARALGLPQEPVEATAVILERLRAGQDRTVGLGRMETPGAGLARWFTFCAGFGLDSEIVREVERRRDEGATSTPGLYLRTGLRHYLLHTDRRHPAITADWDDAAAPMTLAMVIVANTTPWTYFGRRPLAPTPEASFDSGIDLFALRRLGIVGTGTKLARLVLGGPPPRGRGVVALHDLGHLTLTSERPLAAQVDGEYLGEFTELRLRAVRGAITIVA